MSREPNKSANREVHQDDVKKDLRPIPWAQLTKKQLHAATNEIIICMTWYWLNVSHFGQVVVFLDMTMQDVQQHCIG